MGAQRSTLHLGREGPDRCSWRAGASASVVARFALPAVLKWGRYAPYRVLRPSGMIRAFPTITNERPPSLVAEYNYLAR